MKLLFYIAFVLIIFTKCSSGKDVENTREKYSFMIAGHVYGSPSNHQPGLHPPFLKTKDFIRGYKNLKFGILTGDVVPISKQVYWDSAIADMNKFGIDFHIAPGNHDRSAIYDQNFENRYYNFEHNNSHFIILSPTEWNIENEQLVFLKRSLQSIKKESKNIFIFCHELIWWSPENEFRNIKINYKPHYPGSSNYWEDVDPILRNVDIPIYIFAGDLGAAADKDAWSYVRKDNIRFIASGMGGGKNDNIIIVDVLDDEVVVKEYSINSEEPKLIESFN